MWQKTTAIVLVVLLSLSLVFQVIPALAYKLTFSSAELVTLTYPQKATIRKACISLGLGNYDYCKAVSQKTIAVKLAGDSDAYFTAKESWKNRFNPTLAVALITPVDGVAFTTISGDGQFSGPPDQVVTKSFATIYFKNGIKSNKVLMTIRIDIDAKSAPVPIQMGSISGHVLDSDSSSPIKGALVTTKMMDNPTISANSTTDANGKYIIENLTAGMYDVQASASSYESDSYSGLTVVAGSDTSKDLNLTILPCPERPVRDYKGVSLIDDLLGRRETGGNTTTNEYIAESIHYIKQNGFNVMRVPYYWESYVYNSTEFLDRLEFIAQEAEANDLCVFFDNHHFYTSSYWGLVISDKPPARGFPSFVVKDFPAVDNDYILTAGPFWDAFLSNSISINDSSVWDVQADFLSKIIDRVDNYDSVVGYEILNEPHLFTSEQYAKLGDYHSYMAQKIRSITDKKIFFDRENTRGIARDTTLEPLIAPIGVDNIVYAPHLYVIPYPDSSGGWQISNFKAWSESWGTEVLIGEAAPDTQADAETLLSAIKQNGFGWSVWSWKDLASTGRGATYYESATVESTEVLHALLAAVGNIY